MEPDERLKYPYLQRDRLKKILMFAYLNRNGLKISKIARLADDELSSKS